MAKTTKTTKKTSAPAEPSTIYIQVEKDGPYLVFGLPSVQQEIITPNEQGNSWTYTKGDVYQPPKSAGGPVALCRCGMSGHKPFCDGAHTHGFDGTTTAPKTPITQGAKEYRGENYTLLDNEAYCAFARFCDAFGQVWNLVMDGDDESDRLAVREACNCPAGRLMMVDNRTGKMLEFQLTKSIGVLEDPQIGCSGPLFVKGGIPVKDEKGKPYEVRNRQTLCRCGRSGNKPFCDGTHASVKFNDDLPIK